MSTITTSTPSIQSSSTSSSKGSSAGSLSTSNDISSQISRITQQIAKLTDELKNISSGSGTTEQKKATRVDSAANPTIAGTASSASAQTSAGS